MGKPPSVQKLTKNATWFSTKFNGYKFEEHTRGQGQTQRAWDVLYYDGVMI